MHIEAYKCMAMIPRSFEAWKRIFVEERMSDAYHDEFCCVGTVYHLFPWR